MHIVFRPGPELIKVKWHDGEWVETDVTDKWMTYLFWPECKVEGATLADCLKLMQRNPSFSKIVFNMWVEEFVEEGLTPVETDKHLLSLELYMTHELDEDGILGLPFPSVHAPAEDADYSIMFVPASKLSHLPITLGSYSVWNMTERPYGAYFESKTYPVSLGQIFYALIWELSYCGSPKERDEKNKEVHDDAIEEESYIDIGQV